MCVKVSKPNLNVFRAALIPQKVYKFWRKLESFSNITKYFKRNVPIICNNKTVFLLHHYKGYSKPSSIFSQHVI